MQRDQACREDQVKSRSTLDGASAVIFAINYRHNKNQHNRSATEKEIKLAKFKMHKKALCHSYLASITIVQFDMLITSISFTCLDGSDVSEVISREAFRLHTHRRVPDWQRFLQCNEFNLSLENEPCILRLIEYLTRFKFEIFT